MPEYPQYPGNDPDQPHDGSEPGPPPPLGAWPPPQQQSQPYPPQQPHQQSNQQPYPPTYQAYGYPSPGYAYAAPAAKHPNATTAMVLGIVALATGFSCGLPLLLAPFAWFMGSRAVREIDASGGQQGGRSEAMAGKVLGIIGSVLLVLALVLAAVLLALLFIDPTIYEDDGTY